MKRIWKRKNKIWTNKKISFVSILIATSVVFVLIFTRIAPIASLPSFKLMAGGLPIKLTGYIFGPFIGAITGALADIISFSLIPTYIHFWYTLSFAIAGFIPGLVGHYMNKKNRNDEEKSKTKINNVNFIITIIILATIFTTVFTFIMLQDESVFEKQKLIKNKWLFLFIATSGTGTMLIATIIFRFVLKPSTLNGILPIVSFSAILEIINTPLTTLGDIATWELENGFLIILTGHLLISPVKIWANMVIILFAYKVISPLIYKKTGNEWEKK